jgi:hypothetical protein
MKTIDLPLTVTRGPITMSRPAFFLLSAAIFATGFAAAVYTIGIIITRR